MPSGRKLENVVSGSVKKRIKFHNEADFLRQEISFDKKNYKSSRQKMYSVVNSSAEKQSDSVVKLPKILKAEMLKS